MRKHKSFGFLPGETDMNGRYEREQQVYGKVKAFPKISPHLVKSGYCGEYISRYISYD